MDLVYNSVSRSHIPVGTCAGFEGSSTEELSHCMVVDTGGGEYVWGRWN
jgi:hypothetical protein